MLKKMDFCCYLIAKENNAISTGTQDISALRLLCFTMLVMTDVTREPHTRQGRMLMENKTRGFCQDWGSSRWMNLLYLTVPGSQDPALSAGESLLSRREVCYGSLFFRLNENTEKWVSWNLHCKKYPGINFSLVQPFWSQLSFARRGSG